MLKVVTLAHIICEGRSYTPFDKSQKKQRDPFSRAVHANIQLYLSLTARLHVSIAVRLNLPL